MFRTNHGSGYIVSGFQESEGGLLQKIFILPSMSNDALMLATTALDEKNYNEMVDKEISNLSRIKTLYIQGDSAMKRQINGSMFPEKIVFDGKQHRTTKVNEAVRLIVMLGEGFREIKNRKRFKDLSVYGMVPGTGIEPVFPP